MSKLSLLREWLKDARSCHLCGAGRLVLDDLDPEVHEFEAEALFDCGARIQLWPGRISALRAADGCPQPTVQKLDEIEQDIEEEEDTEEEGEL